jgi:hypothetical protein
MGVPPESTTVEIDLLEEDGATTLRLVHHGLPPPRPWRTTSGDGRTSWMPHATPCRPDEPMAPDRPTTDRSALVGERRLVLLG